MPARKRTQSTEELQGQLDALRFLVSELIEEVVRERPEAANRLHARLMIVLDENNLSKIVTVRSRQAYSQCEKVLSEACRPLMET